MPLLTAKEKRVYEYIKHYIEQNEVAPSYADIQKEFDYRAASSIQQFIEQLVHKGYLKAPLGESRKRALELVERPASEELAQVPLEGLVAAGVLHEAISNREYIEVPKTLLKSSQEYFALKVKGDSMIDDCIMDGDIVVIRRELHAQNGQTVVALVGEEATIKRFYKRKNEIELQPANPKYKSIIVRDVADFKILGILSSVIRNY